MDFLLVRELTIIKLAARPETLSLFEEVLRLVLLLKDTNCDGRVARTWTK